MSRQTQSSLKVHVHVCMCTSTRVHALVSTSVATDKPRTQALPACIIIDDLCTFVPVRISKT